MMSCRIFSGNERPGFYELLKALPSQLYLRRESE